MGNPKLVVETKNIFLKKLFLLPALIAGLGLILTGRATAQTFTTLHNFTDTTRSLPYINSDGAWPTAGPLPINNRLYGTTAIGGGAGCGVVYAIKPDGTGFTNLYTFNYVDRSEQIFPKAGLLFTNNLLYGTDCYGGIGAGSVFSLSTNGTGFTVLHSFDRLHANGTSYTNVGGAVPSGALLLAGDTFYGTAAYGGRAAMGTVYAVNTNGTGFRVLYDFPIIGNGNRPQSTLVISPSGQTLYGTASSVVFAINTDGSGFRVLHAFSATGGDGWLPKCGLVISASGLTLYGTTQVGGSGGSGTVFAVNTDESGFRTLHHFTATIPPISSAGPDGTDPALNSDGASPVAPLILSDAGNILYGTTSLGGSGGGTVFAVNTDGTGFAVLHSCPPTPLSVGNIGGTFLNKLILVGHTIYGTGENGGTWDQGTVFSLTLGLSATVSAIPARPQSGDTITVAVNVHNDVDEIMHSVRLDGPITVSGTGGVSPAGFRGPTMVPALAPGTSATFTYLYTATNDGPVTFTATATGTDSDGVVTTVPASANVLIACKGDLMIKTADTNDTTFFGEGLFQTVPDSDQNVSLPVGSQGTAGYVVRLQNDVPFARTFVLRATTNTFPNWTIKVLAANVNIMGAMTSANGWTTPMLASGAYLDLQVSLAPMNNASVLDNKSILIKSLTDSASTNILDAVILHATLVPVPVKVTLHALTGGGYTPVSVNAGKGTGNIDMPLVPVVDQAVLAQQPVIHGGLVADGVTPLVIELSADPASIGQFPEGLDFAFQANVLTGGSLSTNSINQRLQLLKNGAWQSATDVVLSAASPVAYVQVTPISSDDVWLSGLNTVGLYVQFTVQGVADGIQAGDVKFTVPKPPILLIHGYNTTGDWGDDFKAILGAQRPFGFVRTVKYGQDQLPKLQVFAGVPVYENTVARLDQCAVMAKAAFDEISSPMHSTWAFTRFDVVAHSQGGVLARMLSNSQGNQIISTGFRNSENYYRGRFHRVVTVGSPHNGSRLLRYMLDLYQTGKLKPLASLPHFLSMVGVQSAVAQEKFDPFGKQIQELNDTSPGGRWQPDRDASFHLVRTVIDNGLSPGLLDTTPGYVAFALNTISGGAFVIPRGSDGVVDFDSMGANVPGSPLANNVFTLASANDICHAPPLVVFGATDSQTASTAVARHVIDALDQNTTQPAGDFRFDSFPVLPTLGDDEQTAIDAAAALVNFKAIASSIIIPSMQRTLDADTSIQDQTYQYQIAFPTDLPPQGPVTWFVEVFGPTGITSDGVELSPGGTNNSQVTITVNAALVGDVLLSATYLSTNNTVVALPPIVVVSVPPDGATLTGFQLLPGSIALPVGTVVSPEFLATYNNGAKSLRYVAPGTVAAASSQPSVVSVADPFNWELTSVGTAQITVNWSGFHALSQITVFDPATNAPPALCISNNGNGQLSLSWLGFATAYVLESNGDLRQTNSWLPVATTPTSVGGWMTAPVAVTNTQQFFRLRWDPPAIQF